MEFTPYVIVILAISFWWSGLVRAGLGFGGAGLMYPVALLAVDSIVFLVPIICVQLMIFSSVTLAREYQKIDWRILAVLMATIMPTFMLGVLGLISFPEWVLLAAVYTVIICYSISYILNLHASAKSRWWVDGPILFVGGYVSGLSLAGAPIIAAVGLRLLDRTQLRATLFVLWFLLCAIKLGTLAYYEVDLQLRHQLWLLPCALVGHVIGMRLHERILHLQSPVFYRWMGSVLLLMCLVSLANQVFD